MTKYRKNPEYITIETLREKFRSAGCELVSNEYHNNRQQVEYIARCGHKAKITVMNFLSGKGLLCRKCKPRRKPRKYLTIDELSEIFSQKGCKVIDNKFNGFSVPINYVCKCGHLNQIELYRFERGQGIYCPQCSGSGKKTIEDVRKIFHDRGCKLISTSYKWNRQKVKYIAKCGHEHEIKASAFFEGEGTLCPRCQFAENGKNNRKYSEDDVKRILAENGCTLITPPKTMDDKMTYIAKCGHVEHYTLAYFLNGYGKVCKKCYSKVSSVGEKIICEVLKSLNIPFEYQYTIKNGVHHSQKLDFYLPQFKAALEYNGRQHYQEVDFFHSKSDGIYSFENQKLRDERKREWCRNHEVRLIEIDGRNWTQKEMMDGTLWAYINGICINEGWIKV